jgi:seryl-tRNA synthetase
MLDRELVTKYTAVVREALKSRGADHLLEGFEELHAKYKTALLHLETLRSRKNEINDEIPLLKKQKLSIDHLLAEGNTLKVEIATATEEEKRLLKEEDAILHILPNIPQGHLRLVARAMLPFMSGRERLDVFLKAGMNADEEHVFGDYIQECLDFYTAAEERMKKLDDETREIQRGILQWDLDNGRELTPESLAGYDWMMDDLLQEMHARIAA